jgi:hypothetical protein
MLRLPKAQRAPYHYEASVARRRAPYLGRKPSFTRAQFDTVRGVLDQAGVAEIARGSGPHPANSLSHQGRASGVRGNACGLGETTGCVIPGGVGRVGARS